MTTTKNTTQNSNNDQTKYYLDLYKTYSDDLKKFDTICWQFPLALVSANFIAFNWFSGDLFYLLALSILNFLFLLPLMKHVHLRSCIVDALDNIGKFLKTSFDQKYIADFSPVKKHWWLHGKTLFIMAYGFFFINIIFFLIVIWKLIKLWCIC